jgi:hypothetical protein
MAFAEVGTGTTFEIQAGTNNQNITYPTGIASGDMSVMLASWWEGGSGITINTPTNFTAPAGNELVISGTAASESRIAVFYRQHVAADSGTVNVSFSGNPFTTVMLMTLRGTSALTFSSVTAGSAASSTTCTAPAVTSSGTQGIIACMGTGDPTTMTTPSGMTAGVVGVQNTNTGRIFYQSGATSGTKASTLGTSRSNGALTILVDGAHDGTGGTSVAPIASFMRMMRMNQ